jgi:hypothetical protein
VQIGDGNTGQRRDGQSRRQFDPALAVHGRVMLRKRDLRTGPVNR